MNAPKIPFPLYTWGELKDSKRKPTTAYNLFRLAEWAAEGMQTEDVCIALFTSKMIADMFAKENPSIIAVNPTGVVVHSAVQLANLLTKLKAHNPDLAWVAIDKVFLDNQFDQGLHRLESMLSALEQTPGDSQPE
jgi:hypothetical protein